MKILLSLLICASASIASAQYSGTDALGEKTTEGKPTTFYVIPKIELIRAVGLNELNDDFAWFGLPQLPIIGLGSGGEFNFQIKGLCLGFDYRTFSLTTAFSSLLNQSPTSVTTELRATETNLVIGYDLLRKNPRHRFEPFVSIGARTTSFSMVRYNTTLTYNQVLGGGLNGYREADKISPIIAPGLRFMSDPNDGPHYSIEVGYRWMPTGYSWNAPTLALNSLSSISVSFGIVLDLRKMFGGKKK